MGSVGGWNPARAQVGSVRGAIEDGQLFAVAGAELPEVQPAAVTIVSTISAMHRRIGQAYAWGLIQADWCQRRRSVQSRVISTWQRRRIRTDSLEASASRGAGA